MICSDVKKMDFGRELIFKTEQPKTKVKRDIDIAHFAIVEPHWAVATCFHLVTCRIRQSESVLYCTDAEITAELAIIITTP